MRDSQYARTAPILVELDMGILDWLTGTERPEKNVPPRSPQEVYQALVGVNRDDASFLVRDGSPEGIDLVSEWRVMNPAWYEHFRTFSQREFYSVLMRLNPEKREVRSTDRTWTVDWTRGYPELVHGLEFQRGPQKKREVSWTIERDENGKLRAYRQATFSSEDLKAPLRKAVLAHGWTWRGVAFGKL